MAMTKAEQLRVKRDKHPNQPRARTDAQKDAYAQKCAKAGNLSKANQTICSELIPSCDENTLPQLQALHPPGDLNFNRQFWPERGGTGSRGQTFQSQKDSAVFPQP